MTTATPFRRLALLFTCALALMFAPEALAQSELRVAPGDGTLNDAIENDTARPADRVYVLERGTATDPKYYGITREINSAGFTLRIKAEDGDGDRPVIFRGTDETGTTVGSRYFNLGGDTYFTGIYFLAVSPGQSEAATAFALNNEGMRMVVDDCVFQGGRSRLIEINVDDTDLFFTNSQFRNLVRNDGSSNGRPIDYRTVTGDTLFVQNTSFLNVSGYLVRYDGPSLNTAIFDHVTVFGTGRELTTNAFATQTKTFRFTNNLVVNAYGFGQEPDDDGEFLDGVVRVDSLDADIDNGVTEADRKIRFRNNGSVVTSELQDYYDARTASGDALAAYLLIDDTALEYAEANEASGLVTIENNEMYEIAFTNPPDLTDYIDFLGNFRDGAADPGTWVFGQPDGNLFPATQPPPEDLSYSMDNPAYSASVLGFPLGDLNYFPTEKAAWEIAITTDGEDGPTARGFALRGAFPNPTAGDLAVRLDLANTSTVSIQVFDALGRRVLDAPAQAMGAGANQTVQLSTSQLTAGVYLARVSAEANGEATSQTVRFTVAR